MTKTKKFFAAFLVLCFVLLGGVFLTACGGKTLEGVYTYSEENVNADADVLKNDFELSYYTDSSFKLTKTQTYAQGLKVQNIAEGKIVFKRNGTVQEFSCSRIAKITSKFGKILSDEEMSNFEMGFEIKMLQYYFDAGIFQVQKITNGIYFKYFEFFGDFSGIVLYKDGQYHKNTVLEYLTEENLDNMGAFVDEYRIPYESDFAVEKNDSFDISTPEGLQDYLLASGLALRAQVVQDFGQLELQDLEILELLNFNPAVAGLYHVTFKFKNPDGTINYKNYTIKVYENDDDLPIKRIHKAKYEGSFDDNEIYIAQGNELYTAGGALCCERYDGSDVDYDLNVDDALNPKITVTGFDKTVLGWQDVVMTIGGVNVLVSVFVYDVNSVPPTSISVENTSKVVITITEEAGELHYEASVNLSGLVWFADGSYKIFAEAVGQAHMDYRKPLSQYQENDYVIGVYKLTNYPNFMFALRLQVHIVDNT